MRFRVELTGGARSEIDAMYRWISSATVEGANRWYGQLLQLLSRLSESPMMFGVAPESDQFSEPVRQAIFKTRRGRRYRVAFVIRGDSVVIFAVRGPGQPPLQSTQIEE